VFLNTHVYFIKDLIMFLFSILDGIFFNSQFKMISVY